MYNSITMNFPKVNTFLLTRKQMKKYITRTQRYPHAPSQEMPLPRQRISWCWTASNTVVCFYLIVRIIHMSAFFCSIFLEDSNMFLFIAITFVLICIWYFSWLYPNLCIHCTLIVIWVFSSSFYDELPCCEHICTKYNAHKRWN